MYKNLTVLPLAQRHQKILTSYKESKSPSASNTVDGEHLQSTLGSLSPSNSKQGHL